MFLLKWHSSIDDSGHVPTQHEHNSPHRWMTVDYVPVQHEHNSPHRWMTVDYVPVQHEHNNPH